MRRKVLQVLGAVLVCAIGIGAAVAVGASDDDKIKACVVKATGQLHERPASGKCSKAELAITISGSAFKKGKKGKSLTINGVAFRQGTLPNSLTINGNAFRSGTLPNSLTINGNSFRTGTLPNSLTINGNSFRTGTLPNTLTINGNSFRSGSGGTLTINGTAFAPGAAAKPGPRGPAGLAPPGKAPATGDPVAVSSGETKPVVSVSFTGTGAHRLMLTGGFDAVCGPCPAQRRTTPSWSLKEGAGQAPLVSRMMSPLQDTDGAGTSVSEIVVTPTVCGPCTYNLWLAVPPDAGGAPDVVKLNAAGARLGLVDLGPVAP